MSGLGKRERRRLAQEAVLGAELRAARDRVMQKKPDGHDHYVFDFRWPEGAPGGAEVEEALSGTFSSSYGYQFVRRLNPALEGEPAASVGVQFPVPFQDLSIWAGDELTLDQAARLLEAVRSIHAGRLLQ